MASTRFHILLEKRINEEIDKLKESLAGGAASDYPAYRWHVGWLYGMKMCLQLCDEIEGEFDERNRSASSG